MTDRESLGPITWRRPADSEGTLISVEIVATDDGPRIDVDVGDQETTAELAGDPDDRPAVLLLDEPVDLEGDRVEAIRLPSGTDDAVTDAVAVLEGQETDN
ncbi:hypothetical protein Hbl1158_10215 [Halobaculum sp. CBA1158]|uniref:hypothetical protein n=1 Tax=Halobaculum sp. CBA1158 TaxID=2904243 RepID=UPI001F1E5E28|nr:hypothetical protein [Halobaculum sp. CBA1158]UIO98908.1 hypothetical protein Hbl1158_10215 [Halobaculum sp. CBA1158]